jgi:hypothetical protein
LERGSATTEPTAVTSTKLGLPSPSPSPKPVRAQPPPSLTPKPAKPAVNQTKNFQEKPEKSFGDIFMLSSITLKFFNENILRKVYASVQWNIAKITHLIRRNQLQPIFFPVTYSIRIRAIHFY